MEIEHRIEDNICIVTLRGSISLDRSIAIDGVLKFQKYMKPFIENENIKDIALNFENVKFIDSCGIGQIVSIFKSLNQRGARLAIYNISQQYSDLLKIIQFDQILDFYKTEEDALANLKGSYGD